jgi:hypothetical protein
MKKLKLGTLLAITGLALALAFTPGLLAQKKMIQVKLFTSSKRRPSSIIANKSLLLSYFSLLFSEAISL